MFYDGSFHGNSMNSQLSYCGLIDAKIRASDKDLPVSGTNLVKTSHGFLSFSHRIDPFLSICNNLIYLLSQKEDKKVFNVHFFFR